MSIIESAERSRVLLVDDTSDLRELMRRALERTGDFEVVAVATNGQEGIEQARRHELDLVLLDIAMPVMDGLEALPLVRQARPQALVVMLSGFGRAEMAGRAAELGAHGYLQKGEPLKAMLGKLRGIMASGQEEHDLED